MSERPVSIRGINTLPSLEKLTIYRELIPDWLLEKYGIDVETLSADGLPVANVRAPEGSRALEIEVRCRAHDIDPMLYLNMADTFNNQLLVLLVIINDPDAPRFNTDRDQNGNLTNLGTSSRNVPAEIAAMRAGLAPGQVRAGLRVFRQLVPLFESFVQRMSHDLFFIEPLSYHNAIVFERYGFAYVRGLQEMRSIDREFRPGGELHAKLDENSQFRQPDAWKTIRGRSWAIHDGILGHSFTGFHMYKRLGAHAGVMTFPDATW